MKVSTKEEKQMAEIKEECGVFGIMTWMEMM